jgi:WD40 repeat protein
MKTLRKTITILLILISAMLIFAQNSSAQPSSPLISFQWSADGTKLAKAYESGLLIVEYADGTPIFQRELTYEGEKIEWSPDGTRLITILNEGLVILNVSLNWIGVGETIAVLSTGNPVRRFEVSPTGQYIATLSTIRVGERSLEIWYFDNTANSNYPLLRSGSNDPLWMAWSSDNQLARMFYGGMTIVPRRVLRPKVTLWTLKSVFSSGALMDGI